MCHGGIPMSIKQIRVNSMAFNCVSMVSVNVVQFGKVLADLKRNGTPATPIATRGDENNYITFVDSRSGNTIASLWGKRSDGLKDITYKIHIN